jgi:hypothetical protein
MLNTAVSTFTRKRRAFPLHRITCPECGVEFETRAPGANVRLVRCPTCRHARAEDDRRAARKAAKDVKAAVPGSMGNAYIQERYAAILQHNVGEPGATAPDFWAGAIFRLGQVEHDLEVGGIWPEGTRFKINKRLHTVRGGALVKVKE